MTRGLPYSLVVHAVVLVLVIVYGNHVTRPVMEPVRIIPFHLVHPEAVARPREVAAEEPKVQPPETEQQKLPPKELPAAKPEQIKPQAVEEEQPKREDKPEPEPEAAVEPQDETTTAETPPQANLVTGPRVDATDSDFPFAWYLSRVEGLIDANWNPPQPGFGRRTGISCTVHFEISRGGAISGVSLVSSSGIGVYDREALGAVQRTHLPPLPPRYGGARLGVTFIFNLEPDS